MKYKDMDLSPEMHEALELAGYVTPTEIQEKSIPLAMDGKDILGQAQTGTGKTASFAIPIIEKTDISDKNIQHLILAPTRELATQIMEEFKVLGKTKGINVIQIIGGISYDRQIDRLKTKPQIIVGSPGRIKDFIDQGKLKLHGLKTFTLDEVDQLLSIGFQKDIEYINQKLPREKQNFFYSATFNKKVASLSQLMLNEPTEVKVSTGLSSTKTVSQEWILAKENQKFKLLKLFIQIHQPKGAIIFCRTRRGVESLVSHLQKDGFKADGIQGDMEQRVRSKVIKNFRDGVFNIVVGTDVLARGIDVGHADYVYNYDLPEEVENYTHRIGRVGRAGKSGIALSFVKPSQVSYMKTILRETNSKNVEEISLPTQEMLDKIFERQRFDLMNNLLDKTNKHQLETFIKENWNEDQMAKILSVFIKKTIKTFSAKELLKGHGEQFKTSDRDNRKGNFKGKNFNNKNSNKSKNNRTQNGNNKSQNNRHFQKKKANKQD